MILKNISIINYRNIRQASLEFSPKVNCFIGNNGEGKTNLLDAVYFLSFCHSCFTHIDSMNIHHGSDFFMIDGNYCREDESPENISVGLKRGQRKRFKRNKKEYTRFAEHIGLIPLIYASPADQVIIGGGGEERRKLMDVVISQLDKGYLDALMRYNKALQQRNALLKQEEEPDAGLLDLWEDMMAEEGEKVYEKRCHFIEELTPVFQQIYRKISGDREQVSLNYVSHCTRGPLKEIISRDRFRDRAVGYSLHGIHRDDLEMKLGDYLMRNEGSQGQTKTYILSLKLAQFEFLKRTATATTPILLLDDIFDKLDSHRVEQIVELVSGDDFGQIFITDTNREHLDAILRNGAHQHILFDVNGGDITVRNGNI